jgi:hypothetical protein
MSVARLEKFRGVVADLLRPHCATYVSYVNGVEVVYLKKESTIHNRSAVQSLQTLVSMAARNNGFVRERDECFSTTGEDGTTQQVETYHAPGRMTVAIESTDNPHNNLVQFNVSYIEAQEGA